TFMGKSTANFADPAEYKALVGDFEAVVFPKELTSPKLGGQLPNLLSVKTEVCFTYIQALRDVVAEFQNNRTNPLLALLRSKSGDINAADFAKITKLVRDLNTGIEALPDVEGVKDDIRDTIVEAAGETYSPRSLSIRSDLSDEADRLFQSLKLFVGESDEVYEGPIHELSLGGANLIFLTLKLLEFHYQKAKQSFANFLVIEEPEAHIHTHIQKTLFDKLDYTDTQVIYSTHSTHISEVSNVERINILARRGQVCEVFQPAAGLDPIEVRNIQRYLDAVRSNLLFAKSVLLVEGDAEEIVIPALIKKVLGLSLDELGISLINIRSTGFANVAVLFHDLRIRKRCGIITDRDAPFFDTKPAASDTPAAKASKENAVASAKSGAERETALAALVKTSGWLSAHFAPHTFEVDLLLAGNQDAFLRALPKVYKDAATLAAASTDLKSNDAAQAGGRALRMANHLKKGWFAVLLASEIDERAIIPEYILEAVFSAHRPISKTSICAVVEHRRAIDLASGKLTEATLDIIDGSLKQFKEGKIDIPTLHAMFLACFPNDPVQAAFNYFSAA